MTNKMTVYKAEIENLVIFSKNNIFNHAILKDLTILKMHGRIRSVN